jgi:small subunit ribosomal protein S17
MAENPENTEETPEETPEAADAVEAVEDAEAGATAEDEAAAGDDAPAAEAEPAGPPPSKREQRVRRKRAEASKRPARTPEERQAERIAERRKKAEARRRRRGQEREKRRAAGPRGEPTPPREHGPGRPKVRQGIVVSDKADKTITVRVDTARRHPRYEKIVRSSTKLHAHDEANDAHQGDTVRIEESRPTSRTKRWRLLEVLERAR